MWHEIKWCSNYHTASSLFFDIFDISIVFHYSIFIFHDHPFWDMQEATYLCQFSSCRIHPLSIAMQLGSHKGMTTGGRPPAGKTHESAHSQHGHRSQNWVIFFCCTELAETHSDVSVTRQAFWYQAKPQTVAIHRRLTLSAGWDGVKTIKLAAIYGTWPSKMYYIVCNLSTEPGCRTALHLSFLADTYMYSCLST